MKILYTYAGLNGKVSGVARYFFEISKRFGSKNIVHFEMLFVSNMYLASILKRPSFFGDYNFPGKYRLREFFEEMYLYIILHFRAYDIVHHTGETIGVFSWSSKPVIITIHDMVPEIFYKNDLKRLEKRKYNIEHADGIICVSHNTKMDLLRFYPNIREDSIRVVYHGYTKMDYDYHKSVYSNFILYVGARYVEYKNFTAFIEAVAPLLNDEVKLVCTGQPFTFEEIGKIESLNVRDFVLNAGYVSDMELANLYHDALCFVYPSLYEGFGLPILEAFANDCLVCLSNTSCFPEIAGDAGIYFDPSDITDMRNVISDVIENKEKYSFMIDKGRKQLNKYSWETASDQTFSYYTEIINKA